MKNLAKLLDQPERLVAKSINKLEKLNGYPSHDARQLAQNTQAVRQKIADLGLDADDTTGEELYQALLVKFHKDSSLIDKAFGITARSAADKRADQALNLAGSVIEVAEIWSLKANAAKKLLRAKPPKKLMKQLNYRSVESMLKRENISEIYLALPYAESASWQKLFNKSAVQLSAANYELRPPAAAAMSAKRWGSVKPSGRMYSTSSLIGAVGLWPGNAKRKPPVLTFTLMLMDGFETLTHSDSTGSLAEVNPALLWWEQAKYLVADCGGQPVSLNYKDIAQDHLAGAAYKKRQTANGRASLWNELLSRYENQTEQAAESVARLEVSASEQLAKLGPRQPAKNLAVEYAEAIANEF